jgi:hypothetical protein
MPPPRDWMRALTNSVAGFKRETATTGNSAMEGQGAESRYPICGESKADTRILAPSLDSLASSLVGFIVYWTPIGFTLDIRIAKNPSAKLRLRNASRRYLQHAARFGSE